MPNAMRGRLAGIAMISYMTGPLLGNARAGWVAAKTSIDASLLSGGLACIVAVIVTSLLLPGFWSFITLSGQGLTRETCDGGSMRAGESGVDLAAAGSA